MTWELYLTYVLACAVITLIPGPTVTVIVGNSLAHGPRAGLLNVAGTQLGLGVMMAILVVGLSSIIGEMSWLSTGCASRARSTSCIWAGSSSAHRKRSPMQGQRLCHAAASSCRASSC